MIKRCFWIDSERFVDMAQWHSVRINKARAVRYYTMHIPDGYLSPSTCAVLYGASVPFWYVALQRVKRAARTQMVPLLSVFSAFSFVVMMFNLPLPGGTTGHAVGVALAAIVLGPWGAMLAVSVALVIQALFFGDGGVTAIGANCFNMAITGSLVAYGCYRLLAHGAKLGAFRRVAAAAVAGYAAINVSALFAAIEFGIQPLLFHDASGAPLYAPYPLRVAIPAMMIGHLTFAGLAEVVIAGGVVAYFQRSQIDLLRLTAPDAPDLNDESPLHPQVAYTFGTRRLWCAIALLLMLTPLGLLAVGSAWGEWSARELSDPAKRAAIANASRQQAPPEHVPQGLEHLSSIWTAPLSRYAPALIRSAEFGYIVSALVGVGLIILATLLLQKVTGMSSPAYPVLFRGRRRGNFLERSIRTLLRSFERSLFAEEVAKVNGLLQTLDARTKLVGLLALILATTALHRLALLAGMFAFAVLLAACSRVPLRTLATRVWLPALSFSGLIALPALFLTPGRVLWQLPGPAWPVTEQGLRSASFLILRVETTASLAALLVLTTPWPRVLRALRFCKVPATAVVILGMTYRYIFLFLKTALDMLESRKSRTLGDLPGPQRRRLAAAAIGVLVSRSFQLSSEVHLAMLARGFHGEIYLLDEKSMRAADWAMLAAFVGIATVSIALGRT